MNYISLFTSFIIFRIKFALLSWLDIGVCNSLSDISKDVRVYDGSNQYIIRFPKKRGPCSFTMVTTISDDGAGNNINVTNSVKSHIGPHNNFFGIDTTPSFLGYRNLTFHLRDGRKLFFDESDSILLS